MSGAPRARYRVAPGGSVGGTLTVPGRQVDLAPRADARRRSPRARPHISGFLAGEDCLATARALQALGVRIEWPATDRGARARGRARTGCTRRGARSRHGQCRHGDAPDDGTARAAALRLDADRRCLADAPADGARGGAAAPDGRAASRRTTGVRRCRSTARRSCARSSTRCRCASAQVKSALLLAALQRRRAHAAHRACALARSHRAHAAAPSASSCCSDGPTHRARGRPDAARGTRIAGAGGFLLGGVLHGRRLCSAAERAARAAQRRRESDAHRAARAAAAHGRGHPRARRGAPAARRDAEPVADIEVRKSALRGITRARGAGAARDR